jgi:oxygen-independent coproporphyrinogen-3 oxidase
MEPETLAGLLKEVPGRPWREATLEAAPGGITVERASAWKSAGIDRVSLGVQSFVQRELARTGRKHTAEIVSNEVGALRSAGIANFNIDLIAGLPGQTRESWNESLQWVERLEAPHVSVYMLEVDEDSNLGAEVLAFGQRYGARDVPDDDAVAEFYETAVERLRAMGILRYEISNFAREGYESRHNLKYWLREPYLGFGADAHSFDGESRWANAESVQGYLAGGRKEKTLADSEAERLFLGLRLDRGIEMTGGKTACPTFLRFIADGLLVEDGQRVRLTPRGVLLSNEVFAAFV